MGSGIRAEVSVEAANVCPVAAASEAANASAPDVSRSVDPTDGETITEEFLLEAHPPEPPTIESDDELTELFTYGSGTVYRFSRERGRGCPCECIEVHHCPVVDVSARGSRLSIVFHAPDMKTLQAAIGTLRESYPSLDVRRLLQSRGDAPEESLVFVDRSVLTDRQLEVLETAYRMGYFEHPKRANAGEVASELDVTTSTFTEHLAAAQRKVLGTILGS